MLERMCRVAGGPAPRVAIVVAHPDDETLGLGAHFPLLGDALLVHVTDGAPRDGADARRAGFGRPAEYALARRRELVRALALADFIPARTVACGVPDKEAVRALPRIVRTLAVELGAFAPELLLTHAYEGGHPDHDALALAVRLACAQLERAGGPPPAIAEFGGYHAAPGGGIAFDFLPAPAGADGRELVVELPPARAAFKDRLLGCFATQAAVLAPFPRDRERFRAAPRHDFAAAPHEGTLYYETLGWEIDGLRWRAHARSAAAALGLPIAPPAAAGSRAAERRTG